MIKKHVRTIMTTTGLDLNQWPLAAIHIGERRLRGQLRSLGVPVGPLLKFGAKAYALKKSWQDRYQPWRTIRDEVQVLGPALQSSFTSTSYYVRSTETQKYFYTDDVVIPSADQPEADDDHVYLPLQQEPSGSAAWEGDIPRRRLREKTAIPQLSMLGMEGEPCAYAHKWPCAYVQKWLGLHRDAPTSRSRRRILRPKGKRTSGKFVKHRPWRGLSYGWQRGQDQTSRWEWR